MAYMRVTCAYSECHFLISPDPTAMEITKYSLGKDREASVLQSMGMQRAGHD